MKFEPWKYAHHEIPTLNIHEPPCRHCRCWNPQQRYVHTDSGYEPSGVTLCHSLDGMQRDFSCFMERGASNDE